MQNAYANLNIAADQAPRFTIRKKSLFQNVYYVVAQWQNGNCTKVARFCEKSCAEYWIEVESNHWASEHPMPRMAA